MPLWRAYIDKRILDEPDENGLLGGEHSRVIDIEVSGSPKNEIERMLDEDEVIGQIQVIRVGDSADRPDDMQNDIDLHLRQGPWALNG